MTNIEPYVASEVLVPDLRRASRALSKHRAVSVVRTSAVDTETDVAVAKVDAMTQATGSGMTAVGRIAQVQTQVEQLIPQASARLNFLADAHVLAVSDVLADLRRDLRRK